MQDFDSKELNKLDSFSLISIGARRCGKTHGICCLLCESKIEFDVVFLFSETAEVQDDYFECIPFQYKYNELKVDIIEKIMKKQKSIKEKNDELPRVLIIADDCINNKDTFYSKTILNLYTLGRHYRISTIFLLQALTGSIHPKARLNADIIIMFRMISAKERKKFVEDFLTPSRGKDSFSIGEEFMENAFNEPYASLVICAYKSSNVKKLEDYVYRYKACDKIPEFCLGHEKHWQ